MKNLQGRGVYALIDVGWILFGARFLHSAPLLSNENKGAPVEMTISTLPEMTWGVLLPKA